MNILAFPSTLNHIMANTNQDIGGTDCINPIKGVNSNSIFLLFPMIIHRMLPMDKDINKAVTNLLAVIIMCCNSSCVVLFKIV
ncbi:hypothetical protein K0040_04070 [Terrisporobacter petrolearius]|uniref:hypothetical protein n=1 Tax=Terrisporobacter petrolearius TaxID=1460447 RepID=UPI001D16352E|nr:hypothetical protein [Terrisporobacter petrolearius]MCC3863488.1 hypothetical protein [Terrisporobacter petrolearius]